MSWVLSQPWLPSRCYTTFSRLLYISLDVSPCPAYSTLSGLLYIIRPTLHCQAYSTLSGLLYIVRPTLPCQAYSTLSGILYIVRPTLHCQAYSTWSGLLYLVRPTLHGQAYSTLSGLLYIVRPTLLYYPSYSLFSELIGILRKGKAFWIQKSVSQCENEEMEGFLIWFGSLFTECSRVTSPPPPQLLGKHGLWQF